MPTDDVRYTVRARNENTKLEPNKQKQRLAVVNIVLSLTVKPTNGRDHDQRMNSGNV